MTRRLGRKYRPAGLLEELGKFNPLVTCCKDVRHRGHENDVGSLFRISGAQAIRTNCTNEHGHGGTTLLVHIIERTLSTEGLGQMLAIPLRVIVSVRFV